MVEERISIVFRPILFHMNLQHSQAHSFDLFTRLISLLKLFIYVVRASQRVTILRIPFEKYNFLPLKVKFHFIWILTVKTVIEYQLF